MTVADHKRSDQIDSWIAPIKKRYTHPVLLDWTGQITKSLGCEKDNSVLLVIQRDGTILLRSTGMASEETLRRAFPIIDTALEPAPPKN
jgi:hypothetical protein